MANAQSTKHSSLGKKLLYVLVALLILLVILYFVATSAAFFKGVILPRVSKSIGAEVTVADASIHPFSNVELEKLKVQPPNAEPLLQAEKVVARYSLMNILSGNINVSEVTVISPVIKVVEDAQGHKNTDAVTQGGEQKAPSKKEEKPPQIDIRNVTLKNATIQMVKKHSDKPQELTELSNLNLHIDQLKNGAPGKMELSSDVKMESTGTNGAANLLAASLNGNFNYALAQNLLPDSAKGTTKLDVKNVGGDYKELAGLSANLNADLSPTEIKNLNLQFLQNGQQLGEIRANGPLDVSKQEGKLNVEIASIDHRVLNIFGAAKGIDFGQTKINSTNQIELAKGGQAISVNGQLRADSFSITQTNQTTPKVDLVSIYAIGLDRAASNALIKTFTINGTQNKRPLLAGQLSKPMKIDWGKNENAVDESAFDLTVNNLNLADWKAFAADLNPAGEVNLKLNLLSQQAGKKIQFDLATQVRNLGAKFGTNQIQQADVSVTTRGQLADLDKLNLQESRIELAQAGQRAATILASGTYALNEGDADLKANVDAALPKVFQLLADTNISATAGSFKFDGNVKQRGTNEMLLSGTSTIADFTGRYGEYHFDNYNANFALGIDQRGNVLEIKQLIGNINAGGKNGGGFSVAGNFNSAIQAGKFDVKLDRLNENALRPFLAPSLGGKKLVSVLLAGTASANLVSSNNISFNSDISLNNLVVRDPQKPQADAPLSAQLIADGAMQKQVLDLRQLQLNLSPTERAKNQLVIKGQVNLSETNAYEGKLDVSSDSFDVTKFYDLYAAKTETAQTPSPTGTVPQNAPQTNPNQEPEAVKLPVKEFALNVNFGRFYLREVAITNLQASGKVAGSRIVLNPMQMTVNGAPVKANLDVNLGVRGYIYDISFSADRVPLEPLANSFMPDKHGQYQGLILADAQIKGAGTTGVNLRKNLNGKANFTFTNANIKIVGPKLRAILVPVATALQIPEIAQSPINWADVNLGFGSGQISVSRCILESEALQLGMKGAIPIADVLTNSPIPNIPVDFELRRSLSRKLPKEIFNSGSPDSKYVALPAFLKIAGTIGDPKPIIDTKALLTQAATQALEGVIKKNAPEVLKGDTGRLLQGILGGGTQQPNARTNQTAPTNVAPNKATPPQQQPTNAPTVNDLIDLFRKKK